MSGSTRETRGLGHGRAIEAPTDERVGKRLGTAYDWEIWSLLYSNAKLTNLIERASTSRVPPAFFVRGTGVPGRKRARPGGRARADRQAATVG